jgi:hypothetical protein
MNIQLPDLKKLLRQRIDEVLHYIWDPIGVAGIPEARDEYDSYVPGVYRLLFQDSPEGEIAKMLTKIEVENMGLGQVPNEDIMKKNMKVEENLRDWADSIQDKNDFFTK